MPGMGEFVAANTRSPLVNVCSKGFPIWHVLSATPPPPSLDKSALRKGQRGRSIFHSMRNCVGRPRADSRLRDRRKFGRLLSADAAVLVCGRFADLRTRSRSGRNSPGAGPGYAHNLLVAAWRQVVGCRLRLPRLVAVPTAPSVGQHQVISRRPRPWACEGRGNRSCLGFRSRWRVLSPLRFSPPG